MKKELLLLLLPFLFISCATSDRTFFLQTAGLTEPDSINISEYENKYGEYDGVYLNYERSFEHSPTKYAFSTWDYNVTERDKYIVFNPDKENLTTFTFTLDKGTKVRNFYLRMCSPNKKVTIYGLNDCIKQKEGNSTTYKFIYPDVKKGTIIEKGLEYTTSVNAYWLFSLQRDLPLQFNIPCEKLKLDYSYPDTWVVRRKKVEDEDTLHIQLIKDPKKKKTTMHYEAADIQPIKDEFFSPFFNEIAKYLRINVTELELGGQRYKSPVSWDGMGSLFKDFAMNKDKYLSRMVSDTTKELIKDCKSDSEKVDKIISYIQENIVIDSTLNDDNIKKIFETRKGDVLSVNGLTQLMLSEAGIKTEYLLIHSAVAGYFDYDFIDAMQFNIPAVRTMVEGKQYVLLPQYKFLPMGYLPEELQDQPALVISNDQPAKLDTIVVRLNPDTFDQKYEVNIDDNGLVSIKEEAAITGVYAYQMRKKLQNASEEEKEKWIKTTITYNEGALNITKYQILKEESYKEPLVFTCEYTIDNLVTITPEEVIFQTTGLFSPSSLEKRKMNTGERKNPIRIFTDIVYNRNVNISYPSSWKIQTVLKDVQVKNTFGELESHFDLSTHSISLEQQQMLKKSKQPKEKYNELLELTSSSSKLSIPALVFKKS